MTQVFKKFLKKSFYIDLEESLTYPSSQKICELIEAYCADTNQNLEFVSKSSPVTFNLDGTLYKTAVNMARGGYFLLCKEV